jgi:hypothetical protein
LCAQMCASSVLHVCVCVRSYYQMCASSGEWVLTFTNTLPVVKPTNIFCRLIGRLAVTPTN